jgi:hypothetical protein
MRILIPLALVLFFACNGYAVDGGNPVIASDPISASTVAINVIWTGCGFGSSPCPAPYDGVIHPCTGTIIDNDLVLTAAHCVKEFSRFEIIFDLNAGTSAAITRDVVAYDIPMSYVYGEPNPNNRSDIALLYFEGGLPNGFSKADLLTDTSQLTNGKAVSVAGFGPLTCPDKTGPG